MTLSRLNTIPLPCLRDLRESVRLLGDFPSTSNPNDALLNYCINAELTDLWERMLVEAPESMEQRYLIALTTGTKEYSLPVNFSGVQHLYHYRSETDILEMDPIGSGAVDILTSTSNPFLSLTTGDRPPVYLLSGVKVTPLPSSAVKTGESLLLVYLPQTPTLVDAEDEIPVNVPIGCKDFVVLGAISRLCIREEQDPGPWQIKQAQALDRILDAARARRQSGVQPRDANRRNLNVDS
jgi:hypothetical protein